MLTCSDTPTDSPLPTRSNTPRLAEAQSARKGKGANGAAAKAVQSKKTVVTYDSDIEPDELVPQYVATKEKLLEYERNRSSESGKKQQNDDNSDESLAVAKLEAKIRRIEGDVLFDKFVAEQQWRVRKTEVEKRLAMSRKEVKADPESSPAPEEPKSEPSDDQGINDEAERIAAEILAEGADDGDDLGGLFDSLPQSEVDPKTGQSQTVVNSSDGSKIVIRDFGKWTGVAPKRVLEEACRSR